MTAMELLAELRGRGVLLEADGDRLRVDAPRVAVTPELRAALAAMKAEILKLLAKICPACGAPLRFKETDRYRLTECSAIPTDYFRVDNKKPGELMGLFGTRRDNSACIDCGCIGTTFDDRCEKCVSVLMGVSPNGCPDGHESRWWRLRDDGVWQCWYCCPPMIADVVTYSEG